MKEIQNSKKQLSSESYFNIRLNMHCFCKCCFFIFVELVSCKNKFKKQILNQAEIYH